MSLTHEQSPSNLEATRHSLAHLLAIAVLDLFPDAQLTLGPAIDDGFYYDIHFPTTKPREEDLPKIESVMRQILPTWDGFTRVTVTESQARALFADNKYKLELIEGIVSRGEEITLYYSGAIDHLPPVEDFSPITLLALQSQNCLLDLCRGGHVEHMNQVDPECFRLTKIAGAYWRGDEKNDMLMRIYGLAFQTKDELNAHLIQQEEAKKRDHRLLGEVLDLFHFDESIGKGLPIWLPKGNIIKEELEKWAKETEEEWGYQRVTTPIITKDNLFYTSGHLPMYKDSMYAPIVIEEENYYIKPMNCPFHHKTFAARPKSYRELPLRLAEYGWCHRYEDSGSLFGLMRVRGMQMNDAHIYVQREKAVEEFLNVIKLHEYYYKILGIKNYEMELALRDPSKMDKYHGVEEDWKDAEEMTKQAMELSGVPYTVVNEGAAFYGPKMDFQIYSSIGRSFTASTNQLDLFMGKQFGLEYTDSDGQKKIPAIIHRAPLGTHERFIGFLIEHFAGAFPVWLSPVQVAILPVSGDKHGEYAQQINRQLRGAGVRVEYMNDDTLGKRIRNAKMQKIPYQIVVGDAERDNNTVTVEGRGDLKLAGIPLTEFIERITTEIKERTNN